MLFSWPSHSAYRNARQSLLSVQTQVKNQKKRNAQLEAQRDRLNVVSAENKATKQLKEGLGIALGGIQSKSDLKKNQAKLNRDLTKSFAKTAIAFVQDPNTKDYLGKGNKAVNVAFGLNVDGDSQVPFTALANYTVQNPDSSTPEFDTYAYITGTYDLKKQKIVNASIQNAYKTSQTTMVGD